MTKNLEESPIWRYETNKKKTLKEIEKILGETITELDSYAGNYNGEEEFYIGFLFGSREFLKSYLEKKTLSAKKEFVNDMYKTFESWIWYERKLVMYADIKEGIREPLSPTQEETVQKAMRRVEKEDNADPHGVPSNFEWGIWNAYLFGSRWITGDEFLSLDT